METDFHSEDNHAYSSDDSSTDDDAPEFIDFGFGFNNPKFSDRILRLEIVPDPPVDKLRKRIKDGETSSSGEDLHDAELNSRSPPSLNSSCKATIVLINSLVLAAKSPVFLKMLTNGMKESEQKTVTISVHASEEKPLLDFFGFLYKSTLSPKSPIDVLNVLKIADRYQVTSCAKYCRGLLHEYPMTLELALSYEELPATVLAGVSFQAQMRAAAGYLSYIESNPFSRKAALKLPLERVEKNILSSKELKLETEDEVFNFALKWVIANYDDLSERSEVFCSRICPLIRFPYMSDAKLNEALHCPELNQVDASKMVAEALLHKAGNLHTPRALSPTQCLARPFMLFPVKVMVINSPVQECIVYLTVSEGDLLNRRNYGKNYTQPFRVGIECFHLLISRTEGTKPSGNHMTVNLLRIPGLSPFDAAKVEYEYAVRSGTTGTYVNKKVRTSVIKGSDVIHLSSYSVPLNSSEYSIDGVFNFRVTVTAAVYLP